MSLLPIDDCTSGDDFTLSSSIPKCNLSISTAFDTYPSYWTCNTGNTSYSTEQFCYVATNTADDDGDAESLQTGVRAGLLKAMDDCCFGGGPGAYEPCVQFCPSPLSLGDWNDCLEKRGYGPSYNDSGVVRDTYCVPGLKQQDDGEGTGGVDGSGDDADARASGDEESDTSSATTMNAKFGLALGLMIAVPVLGRFL